MKKAGREKNFHFGIFEVKKWEKWVCCVWAATPQECQRVFTAIGDEPAESRSVATVKDANLANPLTSEEDMRPSPQGLGKERDATHSAPRG